MRCTIYTDRPAKCHEFEMGSGLSGGQVAGRSADLISHRPCGLFVFDMATGKLVRRIGACDKWGGALAYTPDGKILVIATPYSHFFPMAPVGAPGFRRACLVAASFSPE